MKIVVRGEYSGTNVYYKITAPWLQIKLLRFLQYHPAPKDLETVKQLQEVMTKIFATAEETHKIKQESNATNSVLLEAISCLLQLRIDGFGHLITRIIPIVGAFLECSDVNMRYLALETMTHIAALEDPLKSLGIYQNTITACLNDKDVTIRRQALDLLYSMCDHRNVREVVAELLRYLHGAEAEIREEMVLKIAILSEKYVVEYTWYIDTILQMITTAGDDASESIWHRVVYIATNNEDLREYAAYTVMQALRNPNCHEMTVKIGGYLLGEYGHFIVELPGCSPFEQFMALQSKFILLSRATKSILLNTYLKFVNLFPEIKSEIMRVLENFQYVLDVELQQRACEYYAILQLPDDELLQVVCAEMPHFPEQESMLLIQLKKKENDTEDKRVWNSGGKDAQNFSATNRVNQIEISPPIASAELTIPKTIKEEDNLLEISPNSNFTIEHISPPASKLAGWLNILHTTSSGTLYEDNLVQICFKSEYQNNMGRIVLIYTNKLPILSLDNFDSSILPSEQIKFTSLNEIGDMVLPSVQNSQIFNLECINPPVLAPSLLVKFTVESHQVSVDLVLPLSVCSFCAPVNLSAADFFMRWRQIGGAPKESQNVFKPSNGIDIPKAKAVIQSSNLECIDGVDPNLENIVAAGIFSASSIGKVGCLLRLEANQQHQVLILHNFQFRYTE